MFGSILYYFVLHGELFLLDKLKAEAGIREEGHRCAMFYGDFTFFLMESSAHPFLKRGKSNEPKS